MEPMPQSSFPTAPLAAFAAALWGACAGSLVVALVLAVAVLTSGDRTPHLHPAIAAIPTYQASAAVPWQEPYERQMYLGSCLLCPALAWLSLWLMPRRKAGACAVAAVLFVPAIILVYGRVFQGAPHVLTFLLAVLALVAPLMCGRLLAALSRPLLRSVADGWRARQLRRGMAAPLAMAVAPEPTAQRWRLAAVLAGLYGLFFVPISAGGFADSLATNLHVCSWAVAPALSYLDPHLTPGIDFESHYGLGHAYCFSYFLGGSLHATLQHYLWFVLGLNLLFLGSLYFTAANFLRSSRAALVATLLVGAVQMEAQSYGYPSNWPVRFPLLFVFIGCAAQDRIFGRGWLPAPLAGMLAGISLFWQTDIGLHLTLGGVAYFAVLVVRERRAPLRPPLFLLSTAAAFAALTVLAFGAPALTGEFYWHLLEPLLLYSTGFGFWLMRWQWGWSYFYNAIAPLITLASVGWAVHYLRAPSERLRLEGRYLLLCSSLGLLLLLKWVNRSIDIIWSTNAAAVLVVLFWWARYAALALGERLAASGCSVGERGWCHSYERCGAIAIGSAMAFGLLASLFHDRNGLGPGYSSSPLVRIARFTKETPTPVNWLCRRVFRMPAPPLDGPQVDPSDVAVIRAHTDAADPVAIVALHDWWYLADAQRAPRFPLLPVCCVYSDRHLATIEADLRSSRLVFVQRDELAYVRQVNPLLVDRIQPILDRDFVRIESSKTLDLYQHRATSAATETSEPRASR